MQELRFPKITWRHELDQFGRIRADQFNLPLATHVPDLYVANQMLIVPFGRIEHSRQQHVVVDRIPFHAGRLDSRSERCFSDTPGGGEQLVCQHGSVFLLKKPTLIFCPSQASVNASLRHNPSRKRRPPLDPLTGGLSLFACSYATTLIPIEPGRAGDRTRPRSRG